MKRRLKKKLESKNRLTSIIKMQQSKNNFSTTE